MTASGTARTHIRLPSSIRVRKNKTTWCMCFHRRGSIGFPPALNDSSFHILSMYAVKKYFGRLKSDMVRSVRLLTLRFVVSDPCRHTRSSKYFARCEKFRIFRACGTSMWWRCTTGVSFTPSHFQLVFCDRDCDVPLAHNVDSHNLKFKGLLMLMTGACA